MMIQKKWSGLPREQIDEIANRYEKACLIALRRANAGGVPRETATRKFMEMRSGIRDAMCNELRDLGVPESVVRKTAFMIMGRAVVTRFPAAVLASAPYDEA